MFLPSERGIIGCSSSHRPSELLLCIIHKRKGNDGHFPAHFCPALECVIMLQMGLKAVLKVEPESWDRRWRLDTTRVMYSRVPMFPGLTYHCPSRSSYTWTFIEEKILCSFIFRTTKMENITSGIYDAIAKRKSYFRFLLLEIEILFFFP